MVQILGVLGGWLFVFAIIVVLVLIKGFLKSLFRSRSKIKITILAVGAHSSTPDGSLLLKF